MLKDLKLVQEQKEFKMKELITKSLFDAVYNCDISKDNDMLRYYNRINIYEFAFKCKEWLLKNNIAFTLNYYNDNSVQFYCEKYHLDIESSSEIEAVIKACNWILELENEKA